jgi:SAM-dependent methyltransferase
MTALAQRSEPRPSLSPEVVRAIRRSRRNPRPTQFDYLHVRRLNADLTSAFARVARGAVDVLDVFCGSRPYEDLLPDGSRCIGFDIDNHYGVADVVGADFLPFEDASFDLVLCTEAFQYVPDPQAGVDELRRVLRPGGAVVIAVPFVWEYDRRLVEHRFTEPELAALFEGWDQIEIVENGGRVVASATVIGSVLELLRGRATRRWRLRVLRPAFVVAYLCLNGGGALLDRAEERFLRERPYRLPMNLLLTARRPVT